MIENFVFWKYWFTCIHHVTVCGIGLHISVFAMLLLLDTKKSRCSTLAILYAKLEIISVLPFHVLIAVLKFTSQFSNFAFCIKMSRTLCDLFLIGWFEIIRYKESYLPLMPLTLKYAQKCVLVTLHSYIANISHNAVSQVFQNKNRTSII